jgi:biopolymer transport protein ExbD
MRIRPKNKIKSINIGESGALSDLAFLLIIFFIVTAVFTVNQGFMLGLPQKKSTRIVNINEIIKIILKSDNTLEYMDRQISLNDLEKILSGKLMEKPKTTLLLKINPEAEYQSVVNILNIVKKLDIANFSFNMSKDGA